VWARHEATSTLATPTPPSNVHDVFEDDSNIHMVMELCTGGSILEHLKGGQPLSEADVADISRCILRFIAQCHTKCAHQQCLLAMMFRSSG
jgi:serine/threonine protein kinase